MTTEEEPETAADQGSTGGTTAVFTMKEAASVAGVSVSTLRRRREDLIGAGADIGADGWKVPMTALVACGLIAGEGPQREQQHGRPQVQPQETPETLAQLEDLTEQVRDLEREVSEWRRRAEVAEARAEERGRALDALQVANEGERLALRMLTAGTSPVQNPVPRDHGWHQEGPQDTYRETPMEGHQGRHSDVPPSQSGVNRGFRGEDAASGPASSEHPEPKGFLRRMMGL